MTEIIVHISARQGPEECRWVVAQLAAAFCREAAADRTSCEPIDAIAGPNASVLLRVTGVGSGAFVAARAGTVRWIGTSPFRPAHKRKNWFVGVRIVPEADNVPDFHEEDVRYQAMRSSGPGGQHVNKTDSAVRATHVPTGLTSFSQDQRSQFANKRIARLKLALLFDEQRKQAVANGKAASWERNRDLQRGNDVRTYVGADFRLR